MRRTILATSAMALMGLPALAQESAQDTAAQDTGGQEVAQQCLTDLMEFSEQMVDDGYWFAGYRRDWGWRGYATSPTPGAVPPATVPADAEEAAAAGPEGAMPPGAAPWGARGWGTSPGYEIHTLQSAAVVLARRGDAEGCRYLQERLTEVYDGYVEQLQKAGVEPGDISAWRLERLAAAEPVSEVEGAMSTGDIVGTELRNPEDGDLGDVEDVVMGPDNGNISYVIVEHGGFFGIGGDYVAVPWDMLMVTPGREAFVVDVSEEAIENAPNVDPERELTGDAYAEWVDEMNSYWQQHREG